MKYESLPKSVLADTNEDFLNIRKLKNITTLVVEYPVEQLEEIDLSYFPTLEKIHFSRTSNIKRILGLDKLPLLKNVCFIGQEEDHNEELMENVFGQLDLKKMLSQPFSRLVLSFFAIPVLRKKYPDFFNQFADFGDSILFADMTKTLLQGTTASTASFLEAKQADMIADDFIKESINPTMLNSEKATHIYDYIISNIYYDKEATDTKVSQERWGQACSTAHTLINKRGVCVGYSQALKYLALKCHLRCELVAVGLRSNFDIIEDTSTNSLLVVPKESNILALPTFILPNHEIVRLLIDDYNWLFCDPTNESHFLHMAESKKLSLKEWLLFCLPKERMILFNGFFNMDRHNDMSSIQSELTPQVEEELEISIKKVSSLHTSVR